uniref:Selenoprotein S n=1 Tax=Phallusia mammillata TaxID=59560 RepID=A0A6F9DR92_9ASCI|nr:selenoprotein S [Phallusia mammillata]
MFIQSYGWFMIFGFVFSMVVWSNFETPIRRFFQKRKRQFDVTDNMTPEQIEARMEAMDLARRRMQEKYDREARQRAEIRQQMEEEKRQRLIDDHDAMKAGKTQSGTQKKIEKKLEQINTTNVIKKNKDAKPLRPSTHSPLGGTSSGPSTRWRPGGGRGPSAGSVCEGKSRRGLV